MSNMPFRYLLLFLVFHEALPYYFYNPLTHSILRLPSLRGKPDGYKLIPPPRSRIITHGHNTNSYCPESRFRCINPYSKAETYQFECERDSQCPPSYKCCPQKCFQHKICIDPNSKLNNQMFLTSQPGQFIQSSNTLGGNPGICEIYNFKCPRPFPYASTAMFRCVSDKQCPNTFKCCQQNCFAHKICSRTISESTQYVEEMKKEEKQDDNESIAMENVTTVEEKAVEVEKEQPVESTTEMDTSSTETTAVDSTTTTETSTESETEIITEEVTTTTLETTTESETTVRIETTEAEEDVEEEYNEKGDDEKDNDEKHDDENDDDENDDDETKGDETNDDEKEDDEKEDDEKEDDEKEDDENEDDEKKADDILEPEPLSNDRSKKIERHFSTSHPDFKAGRTTPDPNSIIAEYSAYYYDYGSPNDTENNDDSD